MSFLVNLFLVSMMVYSILGIQQIITKEQREEKMGKEENNEERKSRTEFQYI